MRKPFKSTISIDDRDSIRNWVIRRGPWAPA
jgi:hypothetical protein